MTAFVIDFTKNSTGEEISENSKLDEHKELAMYYQLLEQAFYFLTREKGEVTVSFEYGPGLKITIRRDKDGKIKAYTFP